MLSTIDVADIYFQIAVVLAGQERIIGDVSIYFTNYNKMQAEIGCTLHENFQEKGHGTEALKVLVDYLFRTLEKHRVVASVAPMNTASIRLIERLGFRKEAHFKESYFLRGKWMDNVIYAILQKEWINQKGK